MILIQTIPSRKLLQIRDMLLAGCSGYDRTSFPSIERLESRYLEGTQTKGDLIDPDHFFYKGLILDLAMVYQELRNRPHILNQDQSKMIRVSRKKKGPKKPRFYKRR